jgi:acyl-coenzyme A thioesterase 13
MNSQLRVTAAQPGKVNFELDILKEHTNRLNILHGGTIASMGLRRLFLSLHLPV